MTRHRNSAPRPWFLVLLITAIVFSGLHIMPASQASPAQSQGSSWTPSNEYGFIYTMTNEGVTCHPTSASESPFLFEENPDLQLHVISRRQLAPQAGSDITFILRGTQQLEANQQAKAVFLRAADLWKQRLRSVVPITIIVDVDFGPTLFGVPFDEDVLGATRSQELGSDTGYLDILGALNGGAETAEEVNLYSLMPSASLPSNRGNTQGIVMPSALLRALEVIPPVADPVAEAPFFGNPPRIGFNSSFSFDFDPSNGIAPNTIDFEAVAVHEIGHLLGFVSQVGITELFPGESPAASGLDMFRFRPGTTMGTFTTAERVLSSGGQQVFFAGGSELALSTGRPDGKKGDKRQASHWKDDGLSGTKIGIMDPTIAFAEHVEISNNDLLAFDTMGYRLVANPSGKPAISSAAGSLAGNILNLSGTVIDTQGDIAQVQTIILSSTGSVLRENPAVGVALGTTALINFNLEVGGLGDLPTAARAQLVFIDLAGNISNAVTVDFSQRDAGGPTIKKATLNGDDTILNVKGAGFRGEVQVEVNGVVPIFGPNNNNKKLGLSTSQLNLQPGPNRLRLIVNNLRSNIFIVNL